MTAALVVAVALLASCSREGGKRGASAPGDAPAPDTSAWEPTSVAGLTCEGLERRILVTEPTRAALTEAFGAPERVEATPQPNRHVPGATDTLFVVAWPGLVANLHKPSEGGDLATGLVIDDNRWLRYPTIGIGAPAARIVAVLGAPELHDETRIVYDCGLEVEQPVTFLLEGGIVRRIEVAFYVD